MQDGLLEPRAPSATTEGTRTELKRLTCFTRTELKRSVDNATSATIETANHDQKHFRRNFTRVRKDAARRKVRVATFLWLLDHQRSQSCEKQSCPPCRISFSLHTWEKDRSSLSTFTTCRYTPTAPHLVVCFSGDSTTTNRLFSVEGINPSKNSCCTLKAPYLDFLRALSLSFSLFL